MPLPLPEIGALSGLPFDEIIDVRSPAEFAEDRIPGAINLPALSNEERARVGTIYVQQDPFLARKLGAALVARNAAAHLEGPLADRPGGWRPLVYCWRGGQRSRSFAVILKEIGWRTDTIEGGYRSWRRQVVRALYDTPIRSPAIVIDGGTGTAKTRLIHHLAAQGAQTLDLEGLARHRGSLFGGVAAPQPAQKGFESELAVRLAALDPARPVFLEAESSRIGAINLPPCLWSAMKAGRHLRLSAPLPARVGHLLTAYDDLIADGAALSATLARLVPYHGRARVEGWQALAGSGDFATLAAELVTVHYDPRYLRMAGERTAEPLALDDLEDATLADAAARLVRQHDPGR